MRIKFLKYCVFVLFLGLAAHLFYMQVIRGEYYYGLSKNNRVRVVALEGQRGRIFDRNGQLLADNKMVFNVALVPQDLEDKQKIFRYLAGILKTQPDKLEKQFKRRVLTPFTPVVVAEDVGREAAFTVYENQFLYPGVMVEESYRRVYPQASVGAHVIGYVGKIDRAKIQQLKEYGYTMLSVVGKSGVEEFYDNYLRADEGGRQIEINNRGEQVRLLGLKNPEQGQDITLTIDQRVQEVAQELLEGRRGSIVIMDLANGEILGMVNNPTFDPNVFVDRTRRREAVQYIQQKDAPLMNRSITGLYPPGSVFKIPVAAATLEIEKTSPWTTFDCSGHYTLGGRRFGCTHVHGEENLTEAIAHSCNVYFYRLGLMIGSEIIGRYAELMGLGRPTNIDLPYESTGSVPTKSSRRNRAWYTGDTLNLSIGQGDVLTTPIQLVHMMAAVANQGRVVHPHVVKSIAGMPTTKFDAPGQLVLKDKTFESLESGLRAAVRDYTGTAHALDIPDLPTYGKTGTAQTGRNREDHAWFVGYTYGSRRKIVYSVFLEHGGSSHNATVIAQQLLMRMQTLEVL